MLISGREATRRLWDLGITERSARRVLATGLAGTPQRVSGVHLYDEAAVDALVTRPLMPRALLAEACPHGAFLARRAGGIAELAGGWPLSLATAFWTAHAVQQHGHLPLIGAVAGFVTLGAEIRGTDPEPDCTRERPSHRLRLSSPGPWFDHVRDRRLTSIPGPSFLLLGVPRWDYPASQAAQSSA
jgi:hypothetical protein